MALTDSAIRNAKPRETLFKISDSGGLQLLVKPSGAKLWRLAYRLLGKQKSLALGIYPIVTLADARSGRDAARKVLAAGVDPSVKRKLDRQSAAITFKVIGEELLDTDRRKRRLNLCGGRVRILIGCSTD